MKTIQFVFLFVSIYASGQINIERRLQILSDSIIFNQISEDLKKNIVKKGISNQEFFNFNYSASNNSKLFICKYQLVNKEREYYRIRKSKSGFELAEIELRFDSNLKLIEIPNFKLYELINQRMFAPALISENKAFEISNPYFTKTMKKSIHNYLIYDIEKDEILWQISRFRGLKKFIEECVTINAETGKYISIKVYGPVNQSFGQIIETILNGY